MKRPFHLTALAATLAVLISALACTSAEEEVTDHLQKATELEAEGSHREAFIELKNALQADPRSLEANLRLGALLERTNQFGEALFYYEEAYRIDPNAVDAGVGVIRTAKFGQLDRAREVAASLMERHPADPGLHLELANLALIDGDADLALTEALLATELAPGFARAYVQLGLAHRAKIRSLRFAEEEVPESLFANAIRAFQQARAVANDDDYAYVARSFTEEAGVLVSWPGHRPEVLGVLKEGHEALGREEGSVRLRYIRSAAQIGRSVRHVEVLHWALERALEIAPEDNETWEELIRLERLRGGSALTIAESRLEQSPDTVGARAFHAKYLALDGRTDEALAGLEASLLEFPEDTDRYLGAIVTVALNVNDMDRARAACDRLAAEYPESPENFLANTNLARAERRWDDAANWLDEWLEREQSARGFLMLAQVELNRRNWAEALDTSTRALELVEGNRLLRPYLCTNAIALERTGEAEAALKLFTRSLQAGGSKTPGCDIARARALFATGNDESADKLVEFMIQSGSTQAVLLFVKQHGHEQPARARELVEAALVETPKNPRLIAAQVRLDVITGEAKSGLARARAASEAAPGNPALAVLYVRTLAAAGDTEGAIRQIEALMSTGGSSSTVVTQLYVQLLASAGRLGSAREELEALEAKGALAGETRVILARLRLADGDEEQAAQMLENILTEDPDHAGASNDLAYLLAKQGDQLERATELAQAARGADPESPSIADTLGWVFHKRGLENAALAQFDAAIELSDAQSSIWATAQFHRAQALAALDRPEEALAAVERALASGSDFAEQAEAREMLRASAEAPASAS